MSSVSLFKSCTQHHAETKYPRLSGWPRPQLWKKDSEKWVDSAISPAAKTEVCWALTCTPHTLYNNDPSMSISGLQYKVILAVLTDITSVLDRHCQVTHYAWWRKDSHLPINVNAEDIMFTHAPQCFLGTTLDSPLRFNQCSTGLQKKSLQRLSDIRTQKSFKICLASSSRTLEPSVTLLKTQIFWVFVYQFS